MRVRMGFEFVLDSSAPTPTAAIVEPQPASPIHRLVEARRSVVPEVPIHQYVDGFGNSVWRWTAPEGRMVLRYDAVAEVVPTPDPVLPELAGTPVDQLPDEVLLYTLPSRYCPSDLVIADAWAMFGEAPDGWARVQAVCDWAKGNIAYGYGNSNASTSGYDAYQARKGVCRDFAHIGVMFCRALNIPARYVYGFLPDIGVPPDPNPMDFHAWFEAYLDGAWRTFDARHNRPRTGRVVIAHGRDAVDTAIMTSYGDSRLTGFKVWCDEVDDTAGLEMLEQARAVNEEH
jgi:transglutaminase-like putative cysteine protease